MKIELLPTPEYGCSATGWDEVYSEHTLTDYAFECVKADRLKRDEWKEAVLDALACTHMDAPQDEPVSETIGRIIRWHLEADAQERQQESSWRNDVD